VPGQRFEEIGAGAHFANHIQIWQLQQGIPQASAHDFVIIS
jgi:hypothetical protein